MRSAQNVLQSSSFLILLILMMKIDTSLENPVRRDFSQFSPLNYMTAGGIEDSKQIPKDSDAKSNIQPTELAIRQPRYRKTQINSSILDSVDVRTYLRNKKAMKLQIECILKDSSCDVVGREFKRLIPLAIDHTTLCKQCNPVQMKKIRQVIVHLQQNYPSEWSQGLKKFGVGGTAL